MKQFIAKAQHVWVGSILLTLTGCGFAHDEVLDGPYRLVAVDTKDEMGICRTIPGSDGDCVGDGLPSDTVFAAGANAKYLAAARREKRSQSAGSAVVEYYYVVRTPDEAENGVPPTNVVGPLTEKEFARAKHELGLPDFSRVFDDLR